MGILNWIRKQWGSTPTETVTEVVVETTKVEEPVEVVEVKEETPKPKRKYKKRAAKKPAAKKPAAKKPAAKKPAAKKTKK